MNTKYIGNNRIDHIVTGSTNADAAALGLAGAPEGTLVTAQQQEAGRGRRGRVWESPQGGNLYFSLLLRPKCRPEQACMVTLVMALAAEAAVRELGIDAGIKWPNDIVAGGRKVCGILTEMNLGPDGIRHVVIGTGINVNQEMFPEEIRQTATSLKLQMGQPVDTEALLNRVLEWFEYYYEQFCITFDLSGLRSRYEEHLVNRGARVRVLDPKGEFEGTAAGINDLGELLVRRDDGTTEIIYAGEVSVRGIYGYV